MRRIKIIRRKVPSPNTKTQTPIYIINKVLEHRTNKGKKEYKVMLNGINKAIWVEEADLVAKETD